MGMWRVGSFWREVQAQLAFVANKDHYLCSKQQTSDKLLATITSWCVAEKDLTFTTSLGPLHCGTLVGSRLPF